MHRYLICPECRNKGFIPSDDLKQPVMNMGGKRYAGPVAIRRYVCLQCGYKWETEEKHSRPLEIRVKESARAA